MLDWKDHGSDIEFHQLEEAVPVILGNTLLVVSRHACQEPQPNLCTLLRITGIVLSTRTYAPRRIARFLL
jgi:hypothetical protein